MGAELAEVQHHHAHAAALMVDSGLDEMVVLTLDGTGYGTDGTSWGGEVLHSDLESYKRVGHLQEFPMLGGEKAVLDVRRLAFALAEMTHHHTDFFDDREAEILRKLASSSPRTTAMGRLLDAISYQLDVCDYRTYDGEPAMKLEPFLERGKDSLHIPIVRQGNVIQVADMFRTMVEAKGSSADKAHSLVKAVMRGMVDMAAEEAEDKGVMSIGISGGVSYNRTISSMAKELVEERGLRFVCHDRLPNGDGCIAVGQCAIALKRMR